MAGYGTAVVRINYGKLQRYADGQADKASKKAATVTQQRIQKDIVRQERVDTGDLFWSIKIEKMTKTDYRVISRCPHARVQEFGRGPVYAKRVVAGRLLPMVWNAKWTGETIFAYKVKADPGGHFFQHARDRLRKNDWLD